MKTTSLLRSTAMTWLILSLSPAQAMAENPCATGFRATFQHITAPMRKIREGVDQLIHKKGRAQAEKVEKILDEHVAQAKNWDEHVNAWEADVIERMSGKRKPLPEVEEVLAVMAAKSPTFKSTAVEFMNSHGDVSFRVMAQFRSRMPGLGGKKVSYGSHFWTLWKTKIRLPAKQLKSDADFALFLTEVSNAMFRAIHPEPGFHSLWAKAFADARHVFSDPASANVMRNFAKRFQEDYRNRYRAFMEGVTVEAYGKPRPEVIRDFYRWGIADTVRRRLWATILGLPEGIRSASTKEGLNARLQAINEAIKTKAFQKEVELLSLETMFVTRTAVEGFFLWMAYESWKDESAERQVENKAIEEVRQKINCSLVKVDEGNIAALEEYLGALNDSRLEQQNELAANSRVKNIVQANAWREAMRLRGQIRETEDEIEAVRSELNGMIRIRESCKGQ